MRRFEIYFRPLSFILFIAWHICSVQGSAAAEVPGRHEVISFSIEDVTRLALENNFDVQIAKFDAHIKRNDLLEEVSIFDTVLTAKASFEDDELKKNNTIAGSKALTNKYSVNLSKHLPTGTTVTLDVGDTRSSTNSSFSSLNPSHEAVNRISVTQSLGKNFLGLADRNQIKITKKDIENSDWTSLERIESSLAQTQEAYWKVVLLTWQLDIKREMNWKAGELYETYKNKITFGLIEDPDLFAAEANMIQRQNEVLGAIEALNSAKDDLLLLLNEDSRRVRIRPLDKLSLDGPRVDFSDSLKSAIENRKDYKKAKNDIDKRKLSLVVKKNSLWPEIDLEASFARNGLARKYREAFKEVYNEDNPEVFIGITVKVPLENRLARGQYNKAKLEQARALVELKKTERKILTEINDLVTRVNIQVGRVLTQKRVVSLQEKKLNAESHRFKFGRSGSDIMIRYQEDLLNAKLAYAQSLFEYRVGLIDLKAAENTLLKENWKGEL
ncbi:MAG TPA: hypothetical protein DCL35_05620 [Candidatus Omnitrophica bacterium]|nr:hypothetical protein [Candidatus Omnitrophota bacterium]